MDIEERITKLEIKISFLENTVEELNSELTLRNRKIDFLEKDIESLKDSLDSNDTKDIEKPPHY